MPDQKESNNSHHRLGPVALLTPNLPLLVQFYHDLLGLDIRRREARLAQLGAGNNEILILIEETQKKPFDERSITATGLYHLAIRVPTRLELARALRRLMEAGWPLQGFADHGVSEAIYLVDPDGNGVEIYRDYPKVEWPYDNEKLGMVIEPLDVDGLFAEMGNETGKQPSRVHPQTDLGYVHLRVASISEAEAFYCDMLDFDLIQRYGSQAVFVSSGGYHHHIAFNTWHSAGELSPSGTSAGLYYFTVRLPGDGAFERIIERLQRSGQQLEQMNGGVLVRDPSNNGVLLTA